MYRILRTARLFSLSSVTRLNSTHKTPIQTVSNMNQDDDDDEVDASKKFMSRKDFIFADSKSSRYKEKNRRKQGKWLKELEKQKITLKTPLSSFVEKSSVKPEKVEEDTSENTVIQDTYVTPDGSIREDSFQMDFDEGPDTDEEAKESDEPIPLAVGGRQYPVWYYAGKLKLLASQNKVQETLDYFYKEMMDKERIAPNLFCYQVVIGICARNGYLKQAFNLYGEMKDRGFTTVGSRKMTKIFTLLANACYRASDSTLAIDRATHFVDEMKEKSMYTGFQGDPYDLLLRTIENI